MSVSPHLIAEWSGMAFDEASGELKKISRATSSSEYADGDSELSEADTELWHKKERWQSCIIARLPRIAVFLLLMAVLTVFSHFLVCLAA